MSWCEAPGAFLGNEILERYGCRMADGVWITAELTLFSTAIGFVCAMALALTQLYGPRPAALAVRGYTTFFRGTPLLCQMFFVYYGFPQLRGLWEAIGLWGFFREPFWCVLFAFTLNTAAYQAEALRGAIQSVPRGQFEGAYALGLRPVATMLRVVLPQAMIVALRPLGNELITMIKASSIASLATLYDLMGATRLAFARSFDLSIYFYAALIYLLVVETVRRLWNALEARLTRHLALR